MVKLKWDQSAQGAIKQIMEKNYCGSLRDFQGNLLLVEINYDKKTRKHTCVIHEYPFFKNTVALYILFYKAMVFLYSKFSQRGSAYAVNNLSTKNSYTAVTLILLHYGQYYNFLA